MTAYDPKFVAYCNSLVEAGADELADSMGRIAEVLIPNEPCDLVAWAGENLVVPTAVSDRSGPMALNPIQSAICRLWQEPGVRQVDWLKPPRAGSTLMIVAGLTYHSAHLGYDVLFYERSEDASQQFNDKKLYPILTASPAMERMLRPDGKAGVQDSWSDRTLTNGATLQLRSAHGQIKSIKGLFCVVDEAGDKAFMSRSKATTGAAKGEGSKIDVIRRRLQEFAAPLLFVSGTPTNVGECTISDEYSRSDKRTWRMPCPHCRGSIEFVPDVRRAVDRTTRYGAGLRYLVERSVVVDAWYECPTGCLIDETDKIGMIEKGWFEATDVGEPGHVGVYTWAAHSLDMQMTWLHVGTEHMRSIRGPEALQAYQTLVLAQAYDPTPIGSTKTSEIDANRQAWTHDGPEDVEVVTFGMDVQKGSLTDQSKPPRVEITFLGGQPNQRNAVLAHHVVSHRWKPDPFSSTGAPIAEPVEPFDYHCSELLWELLERDWILDDGRVVRAKCGFVDTGWNPEAVHRWLEHPRTKRLNVVPIRGESAEGRRRAPLLPANLRYADGRKRGTAFLAVGSQAAKDRLMECVAIPVPGPKSITYAADLDADYADGLLAEVLVEGTGGYRRWEPVNKKSNSGEELDCAVYAYAAQRYLCRKDPRLARRLDEISPEAQAAAEADQRKRDADEAAANPGIIPAIGTSMIATSASRSVAGPGADGARARFDDVRTGRVRRQAPDEQTVRQGSRAARAVARSRRSLICW